MAVILAAAGVIALVCLPSSFWAKPVVDDTYQGFDPNYVFVDPRGSGSQVGIVSITPTALHLQSVPFSDPTVQLTTSPLSFSATLQMRILNLQGPAIPFQTCLWNSVTYYRSCIVFGPPPDNQVFVRTISPYALLNETTLGNYSPGQLYRIALTVDKVGGQFSGSVSGGEHAPFSGSSLRVFGGRTAGLTGEVASDPVRVTAGSIYSFGGYVRVLSGSDAYKLNVFWLDKSKRGLGFSNDWRPVSQLSGWSQVSFSGVAPRGAVYAQVHLAAGDGTTLLVGEPYLRRSSSAINLLSNPTFADGAKDWRDITQPEQPLDVIVPGSSFWTFSVTRADSPELFAYFRHYLELSSPSSGGTSTTTVEDYSQTLPSQRWAAVRTDDATLRPIGVALAIACALLCSIRLALLIRGHYSWSLKPLRGPQQIHPLVIAAAIGALFYVAANALLFQLGAMPFDMISQQVWSYTGATYGMSELYYRTFTAASLAPLWAGAPLNEPGYAYGIATAYYYTGIGYAWKLFLNGPSVPIATSFSLEFLIKFLNVLFGVADGILIALILRRMHLATRASVVSALLFLLNPAVVFAMSIWGQIETVAIFIVLMSIYCAAKGWRFWAWFALIAAAFSKPQVMVLVPILAVVYLRGSPLHLAIRSLAWAIAAWFLLLTPFVLTIGPTLPVDVALKVANIFGEGIDPTQNSVGGGSYSLWPLITYFVNGQSALARFGYPSTNELLPGITYNLASNAMWAGLLAGVGVVLALFRRLDVTLERWIPFVAFAMLGFLMFKTGMVSRYFVYSIPLVILTRRSMSLSTYAACLAVLTATTSIAIFGEFGIETAPTPWAAPAFQSSGAWLTKAMVNLYQTDWVISAAVAANLWALIALATAAGAGLFRRSHLPPTMPEARVATEPALVDA